MTVSTIPPTPDDRFFDEPFGNGHALHAAWQALADDGAPDRRVVASNLAAEPRVETVMRAHWTRHWGDQIRDRGLDLYDAVNRTWLEHFVRPAGLVRFAGGSVKLPPGRRLIHVDPLGRQLDRAVATTIGRAAIELALQDELGGGPWLPSAKTMDPARLNALGQELQKASVATLQAVVDAVLSALPPTRPFWWASLADDVEDYRHEAAALCSALGLGSYDEGDWLLVFEYPVSEAGLLWRPTTPEAGCYPFHYPGPADQDRGWSMPLRATEKMCTEVLHHALAPAAAAQAVVEVRRLEPGWSRSATYAELLRQRERHRQALTRAFPSPGCLAWIARHAGRC